MQKSQFRVTILFVNLVELNIVEYAEQYNKKLN